MFIVHVVGQFHPGVGGLENVVLELASAQANAGHRVRVVTLDRLFDIAKRKKLAVIGNLDGIEIVSDVQDSLEAAAARHHFGSICKTILEAEGLRVCSYLDVPGVASRLPPLLSQSSDRCDRHL
jgi:hypothetical protein